MKKIISIKSSIRILFILHILLLVFIVLPLSFSVVNYFHTNKLETVKRETYKELNSLIKSLNKNTAVTDEVIIQYNNLDIKIEKISEILDINFNLNKPDYSNSRERDEYIREISKTAASLLDSINSKRVGNFHFLFIISSATLLTALGITLYTFFLNYRFSCFFRNLINGLENIKNLLNFQKKEKITKITCQQNYAESGIFSSIFTRITANIERDRKIQDIDIHGNLDDILKFIYKQISEEISCDRIALAFIDKHNTVIAETAYASYQPIYLQPGFTERISDTSLDKLLKDRTPRIINNLEKYASNRDVSLSTQNILRENIRSSLTVPMFFQNRCIGFLFISSLKENAYTESDSEFALRIAGVLKQKLYVEFLIQEIIAETSNSFITLMHEKDNETSLHIKRMTEYSYLTALKYYNKHKTVTPRFIREIKWFAPLHDIGKIGIPDRILLKEGPLDRDEFSIMKTHVDTGKKVIENMNSRLDNILTRSVLQTAVDIIGGHHEKFSGHGYPEGLKGTDIPLAGRIVAIADVFDALTSARPYKKALSVEEALNIMENEMKGHFDPKILACFKETLPEILVIYNQFKEV